MVFTPSLKNEWIFFEQGVKVSTVNIELRAHKPINKLFRNIPLGQSWYSVILLIVYKY